MLPEIAAWNLKDRRRSLIGWAIGLGLLILFTMAFWPTINGNTEYDKLLEGMPDSLKSFIGEKPLTSPEGYLEAQLFLYLVPLLYMIYAIGRAADSVAGEERRKTIDLVLTTPVSRGRVVAEKSLAAVVGVGILAALTLVSLEASAAAFNMDIGLIELAAAVVGSALLALFFAALSLLVSCATGKKGMAIAVGATAATASYFLNSLAPLSEPLKPYRVISPFHWYLHNSPLTNGFDTLGFGGLIVGAALFFGAALVAFDRRDVSV
jgi:beta-exotoxin I transport system permease protein